MHILGPQPGSSVHCEHILRALPDWFGIESATQQYIDTVPKLPTFTAFPSDKNNDGCRGRSVAQRSEGHEIATNAQPAWPPLRSDHGTQSISQPIGLLSIKQHFPTAAEIYLIAVLPDHHRIGVGRALIHAAENWLRPQGVRYFQVKTLSPSRPCEHYERTRRFYLGMGFEPFEEMPTLWDPRNPCLIMIKTL